MNIAKQLIDNAKNAKFDAVKFQKRDPNICVPEHQKNQIRNTPWGNITYLDYKKKIEFGYKEFKLIENHLNELNLPRNINKFFSRKNLNKILKFMKTDKKNNTNKINLVLLKKIGHPIYKLQFNEKKIKLFLGKELID